MAATSRGAACQHAYAEGKQPAWAVAVAAGAEEAVHLLSEETVPPVSSYRLLPSQ
jgi:hypothetical protein